MKKDGEREEKVEKKRRIEGRKDVPSHVVLAASQQQLLMKHFGSVPDSSHAARSALSPPILPSSEFNTS